MQASVSTRKRFKNRVGMSQAGMARGPPLRMGPLHGQNTEGQACAMISYGSPAFTINDFANVRPANSKKFTQLSQGIMPSFP